MTARTRLIIVVMAIQLAVAAMHAFRLGQALPQHWQGLYYSYASDLALPFAAYFLLLLATRDLPWLQRPVIRLALVFGAAALAESLQYFGLYAFGVTFDPLDYLAYGLGAGAAYGLDRWLLPRWLESWGSARTQGQA